METKWKDLRTEEFEKKLCFQKNILKLEALEVKKILEEFRTLSSPYVERQFKFQVHREEFHGFKNQFEVKNSWNKCKFYAGEIKVKTKVDTLLEKIELLIYSIASEIPVALTIVKCWNISHPNLDIRCNIYHFDHEVH